jgi:glycopeptide antibiotics resistance protein
MIQAPPAFRWIGVAAVGLALAVIALGHTGPATDDAKFVAAPFAEYSDHLRCILSRCASIGASVRFLVVNGLGNVVVFMPFGAALVMALWSDSRHPLALAALVGLIGMGVSLAFEIVQVWIPGRVVAVDDVITNTLGALSGAAVVIFGIVWLRTQTRRPDAMALKRK